jgi:hypothetical protein
MKDKPPPAKPTEQTPFERFREMTQRLLQVDKKDLPKSQKHKRRRRAK